MVYLKPLYRTIDRLAKRQSSTISTEAHQGHVKICVCKMRCIFLRKSNERKIMIACDEMISLKTVILMR